MVELERRKIEREKRVQAEKAMEALEVSKTGAQAEPSKEDVAFIVSIFLGTGALVLYPAPHSSPRL